MSTRDDKAVNGDGTLPLPERSSWRLALVVFVAVAAIYAAFAGPRVLRHSPHNHFVYLADSYLHGTLQMRVDPPHENDWAYVEVIVLESGQELRGVWYDYGERLFKDVSGDVYHVERSELPQAAYRRELPRCPLELPPVEERTTPELRRCAQRYVSFPPGPAVLMMPGVAIAGMGFNDVLFTLLFGALSAALLFLLLERLRLDARTGVTRRVVWLVTTFFALGSCALWCSTLGQVWYTAMVVAASFTLLFMHFAIDAKYPLLAGAAIAGAFAARAPVVFSAVFFAWFLMMPGGQLRRDYGRAFWWKVIKFGAVPLVVGGLLMWANYHRFESVTEFGHRYLSFGQLGRVRTYGLFNVHFLSLNLTALLTALPKFLPESPWVVVSHHGMAIWFSMPPVLWAVWPRSVELLEPAKQARVRDLRRALWLAVAVLAIPHLFYHNTGWSQFSYRFAMDYLPYLAVLIALSGRKMRWLFGAALLFGIVVNGFGAITFQRAGQHYEHFVLEAVENADGVPR